MNRIRAFRLLETHDGVDAWELAWMALNPHEALTSDIVSWQPSAERLRTGDTSDDNDLPCVPHALVGTDGARRSFKGLLVARDVKRAATYLRKRYDPRPGTALAELFSAGPRKVESAIERQLSADRMYRRRRRLDATGPLASLGLVVDDPGMGWSRITRGGQAWLARFHHEARCWAAPILLQRGAHTVRQEAWTTLPPVQEPGPASWWDGERGGVAPSLDDIPFALRVHLEAHGRPLIRAARHGLHLSDLSPAFLVRVPSRRELAQVATPVGEAPAMTRFAGIMAPSSWPLRLHADLPVIDDPREAAAVLCRVGKGHAWVPHAPPAMPRDLVPDELGEWRVGCRIAALAAA